VGLDQIDQLLEVDLFLLKNGSGRHLEIKMLSLVNRLRTLSEFAFLSERRVAK
jgi:hypothetical protein